MLLSQVTICYEKTIRVLAVLKKYQHAQRSLGLQVHSLSSSSIAMPSKLETTTLVTSRSDTLTHYKRNNGRWKSWLHWVLLDSWTLESLSMTVAIAALAAMIILLITYNGQPIDNWPYTVKINTVLSTLSTIMKGFLLMPVCACLSQLKWLWYIRRVRSLQDFQIFDSASRGPWGAVQLLFHLRFWHLASIGSLIIL